VNDDGDLVLRMHGGEVRQRRAAVFEQGAGGERPVAARYVMTGDGEVGFDLGEYDRARPLVIDPALVYATYFSGGGGVDLVNDVAVDPTGAAYATDETNSLFFPTTSGVFDPGYNGQTDAFVTKFTPDGSAVHYSTYLGGTGRDFGMCIAVNGVGGVFVTGAASQLFFPTTPNAFDTTYNGGSSDTFVLQLTQEGSSLIYSTYLGGPGADVGCDIALAPINVAHVTGRTTSAAFPTTAGAFDTSYNGGAEDAFVAKLSLTASELLYSTFLGGGGGDAGCAIVDGLPEHGHANPLAPLCQHEALPGGRHRPEIVMGRNEVRHVAVTRDLLDAEQCRTNTVANRHIAVPALTPTLTERQQRLSPGRNAALHQVPPARKVTLAPMAASSSGRVADATARRPGASLGRRPNGTRIAMRPAWESSPVWLGN